MAKTVQVLEDVTYLYNTQFYFLSVQEYTLEDGLADALIADGLAELVVGSGGGGGGTPAGGDGDIQINDNGAFGAANDVEIDKDKGTINIGGSTLKPDVVGLQVKKTVNYNSPNSDHVIGLLVEPVINMDTASNESIRCIEVDVRTGGSVGLSSDPVVGLQLYNKLQGDNGTTWSEIAGIRGQVDVENTNFNLGGLYGIFLQGVGNRSNPNVSNSYTARFDQPQIGTNKGALWVNGTSRFSDIADFENGISSGDAVFSGGDNGDACVDINVNTSSGEALHIHNVNGNELYTFNIVSGSENPYFQIQSDNGSNYFQINSNGSITMGYEEVTITDSQNATSVGTGALRLANGGLSVALDSWLGGQLNVLDTTQAGGTMGALDAGAIQIQGGATVGKDILSNGSIESFGSISSRTDFNIVQDTTWSGLGDAGVERLTLNSDSLNTKNKTFGSGDNFALQARGSTIFEIERDFSDVDKIGFFGTAPVSKQASTTFSGGATVDTEARASLQHVIDVLEAYGLMG